MENETIIGIVIVIGALMGTIVPYTLKVWQDSTIKFDINYGYALIFAVIIMAIGLFPDSVPEITLKIIVTAFAAGYGLQTMINKAVPSK